MNVYRNIDRQKLQFDFLVFRSPREYYEDEIERMGGRVFHVPIMEGSNLLHRKRMLKKFFAEHSEYVAVHGHMAALGADYLRAARDFGIQTRISHSHIADFEKTPRNYIKQAFQRNFGAYATERLACSEAAGEFMYPGSDFEVVNNGIDIGKFAFDEGRRRAFREKLGVAEDTLLLGHVGRFEYMKNHEFLIDAFAETAKRNSTAVLLLAGDGALRDETEQKVNRLGLRDRVVFLGVIEDMPSFYDGIDCFVMPSRSEGLPFSAVEAQCSGLPCVLSTGITRETALTDLVVFLDLSSGAEVWAKALNSVDRNAQRKTSAQKAKEAGFDIEDVVEKLVSIYLKDIND